MPVLGRRLLTNHNLQLQYFLQLLVQNLQILSNLSKMKIPNLMYAFQTSCMPLKHDNLNLSINMLIVSDLFGTFEYILVLRIIFIYGSGKSLLIHNVEGRSSVGRASDL